LSELIVPGRRRRLWLAGTTVLSVVVALTVALTVASSADTANLSPQSKAKPPPHWFVNSPVSLTFHVLHKRNENGIARLRESGNIGGERFDVVVAFNNDDTGPQSYTGHMGHEEVQRRPSR
jgi:hypothetical protein